MSLAFFFLGKGAYFLKNQIKIRPYINLSKIKERVDKFREIGQEGLPMEEKKVPFVAKTTKVEQKAPFMKSVKKKEKKVSWQVDYSMPPKRTLLRWKTVHFEKTHFDNPQKHYVENIELNIQFKKIDHRQLFKNYLAALSKSREIQERSKNLMAQKGPKKENLPRRRVPQRKLDKVKQVALAQFKVKSQKTSPVIEDLADRKVSSQKRSAVVVEDQVHQKVAKSRSVVNEEELVAFDYPEGEEKGKEKYNPFLPKTYKSVDVVSKVAVLSDVEKAKRTSRVVAETQTQVVDFRGPEHQGGVNTQSIVNVSAQEFSLRRGPSGEYQHFEIRPDYSGQETWGDQGLGQVSIQRELNSEMGVMGISLYGRGIMDTRMDLVLERGVVREISIPVFLRDEFEGLQSRQKSSGGGGHLFVELDSSTESVGIDREYESAVYLNKKLEQVGPDDDYNSILFMGVGVGATTLEYIRNGYEDLRKVVLVEEGAIYYDPNEYLEMSQDIVQIKQRNMLGPRESDLNIEGRKITQFNSYEKVSQIGPSQYDLTTNRMLSGTRKYVELSHMSSSLYLGRWDAKEVVIPSEDYIAYFLKVMGLRDLSKSCLVQLNFRDKVEELDVEGKNGEAYISIDQIYLDDEGEFSESLSPLSVRGFFLSNETGVIAFKIKYKNGKEDYLNSYCSSSSYIIEQI